LSNRLRRQTKKKHENHARADNLKPKNLSDDLPSMKSWVPATVTDLDSCLCWEKPTVS